MILTRIDSNRDANQSVSLIELKTSFNTYVITEEFDGLKIHKKHDPITVSPCCSNEIRIK